MSQTTPMHEMDPPREDPATIYARIRARRRPAAAEEAEADARTAAHPPPSAAPASGAPAAAPDESHAAAPPSPGPAAFAGAPAAGGAPGPSPAAPAAAAATADADAAFPRSATMRFVLDHPVAAVTVGLPLAVLAWRSVTSRRLLGAALRLGSQPMVWEIARVSMQTAQRLNERSQTRPRRPRPEKAGPHAAGR